MENDAYEPYTPLNTLKPIAPDLWIVDGPEIAFAVAGLKLPFPTRMTVIRLADGALWVHSPTALTEELARALAALGPVRYLIAPNTIHYWQLPDWAGRYPQSAGYGVAGLARKAKRPLPALTPLGPEPPAAWAGQIDQVLIAGDVIVEADFFHRASRTLILTDLVENFEPSRVRNRWLRLLVRWSGAADPDGKAPIDMQLSFLRQRRALRAAVRQMISWAPERVILAHGRWYECNGAAELARAFRWVL